MEKKRLLGVYDYTVILTYLSAASAFMGIILTLSYKRPYMGCFFLMACGMFDAFDGKIARTKKNRTEHECRFGIEIDSFSDLVAFGVLPASIGVAMFRETPIGFFKWTITSELSNTILVYVAFGIYVFYFLAALCRLSYFNIVEADRQKAESETRKYFEGLPVTTSAIVLPVVLGIQYVSGMSLVLVYNFLLLVMGGMFIGNIKIKKASTRNIIIMCVVGLSIVVLFLVRFFILRRRGGI